MSGDRKWKVIRNPRDPPFPYISPCLCAVSLVFFFSKATPAFLYSTPGKHLF